MINKEKYEKELDETLKSIHDGMHPEYIAFVHSHKDRLVTPEMYLDEVLETAKRDGNEEYWKRIGEISAIFRCGSERAILMDFFTGVWAEVMRRKKETGAK